MIALGQESRKTFVRWTLCGVVVFAVHAGATAWFATFSDPMLSGSNLGTIILDLDDLPGGAPPGEGGAVPQKDVDLKKEVDPDIREPDDKKEGERPPERQPDPPPPPVQKEAAVSLPPPPRPDVKPVKKRAPVVGSPSSANAGTQSAGGGGDLRSAYGKLIVAHLNSNKRYPEAARARHDEGTVMLSFTLNRGGNVVASHIARGSGSAELDREALEMLKRAQPFPAPPPGLSDAQFPFTAPMRYYLR